MSTAVSERRYLVVDRGVRKRLAFTALLVLLLAAATTVVAEVSLRLAGFRPWQSQSLDVWVEPGGSLFVKDARLGYRMRPGNYRLHMHTGYEFRLTNNAEGYRISELNDRLPHEDARPKIWLFGCSFTFGYAVDDESSIAWQLQAHLPQYDVVNYGVPGYGTVQGLLQMQELLKRGQRPRLAIFLYFDDHDRRNTLLRGRRKLVSMFNRLGPMSHPYVRIAADGQVRVFVSDELYRPFPLMRYSAFSNGLERLYNAWEAHHVDSHATTKALFSKIARLCADQHIPLLVAGFSESETTEDTLSYCREHDIPATQISFSWKNQENWNWPADAVHPSVLGYARLAANLKASLLLGPLRVDYEARTADSPEAAAAWIEIGSACVRQLERAAEGEGAFLESEDALEQLAEARRLVPEDARLQLLLAEARRLAGDDRTAMDEYRAVLHREPLSNEARRELAWLLATTEHIELRAPQEAIALAQAVCHSDGVRDPEAWQTLAAAYASAGNYEQATRTAVKAVQLATLARRYRLAQEIDRQWEDFRNHRPLAHSARASAAWWPRL